MPSGFMLFYWFIQLHAISSTAAGHHPSQRAPAANMLIGFCDALLGGTPGLVSVSVVVY
jgi:hypothetical protein